jgi:seryl-tRNA synthetase
MLNSTLTATERTLCCLLENYQTPEGVRVPPALQPFLPGIDFIPFRKAVDKNGKYVDLPKPAAAANSMSIS